MAKVVFRPSGKTIECEVGDNLLEVARRADVFIEAPSKSCGKCKVKLLTGEVNQEVSSHLTDEDKANGYILACCTTIIGDIEVLTNSSLDMAMRGMKVEGGDKAKDKALFDKAVEIAEKHNITLENNIKKTCITLDEPTLDDNISDVDRLERHISMNFGKQMTYDIEVLKVIPKAFRKNNFEITITYREFDDRLEIIDVEPGNTESELYGLAIDIGTTSVVVCLVNMITNEVVEKGASGNGQLQFGADVINRIVYAIKKNNIEKAKAAVVDDTLNMLINELVKELKKQNNMTIISITHDIEEAKNADRVILLNKGEIVDCDKPQKILTNEKLLKELKLDIPFSLKIARKLQKKGYQIKDTLDVEELEKQLCQLHAKV